jgi:hypothetical protein
VEAEALAEADQQAREGPYEARIVVAADQDEENYEGLNQGKVGVGEEFGLRQSLLDSDAVFLYKKTLARLWRRSRWKT